MKKSFNPLIYKKATNNDLILFSISAVLKKQEKCTFERLVGECFSLFPEVFGFVQYVRWPDSRKLDRPLRTLRNKKLITGSPKTSFFLTKNGKKRVEEIAKTLGQRELFR